MRRETANLGVFSFLQKPFQVRTLVAEIQKALSPGEGSTEEPHDALEPPAAMDEAGGRKELVNQPR